MAFTSKFFLFTLHLVCIVCTAHLSFIFCTEIRKDLQLSEWDYGDGFENWWKEYLTSRKKANFRWEKFTPTPLDEFTPTAFDEFTPSADERDLYTPSSTAEDDYDSWLRKHITTPKEPNVKKILTPGPFDERYIIYPSNKNHTFLAVIVVGIVFMFLVFGAGAIYCIKRVGRDMDRNAAASVTDSRLTNPHLSRRSRNNVPLTPNLTEATGNLNNTTDKPPSYDVVVLNDLSVQYTKYPEVNPSIPECPPPKYEEYTMQKY